MTPILNLPFELFGALCKEMLLVDLDQFRRCNRIIHAATKGVFLAKKDTEVKNTMQTVGELVECVFKAQTGSGWHNPVFIHVPVVHIQIVPVSIRPHALWRKVRVRVQNGTVVVDGPFYFDWIEVAKSIAGLHGVRTVSVGTSAFLFQVKSLDGRLMSKRAKLVNGRPSVFFRYETF